MTDWDARFMEMARMVATWSKDRSTGVGCVLVSPDRLIISTGYNGFPRGLDDDNAARHQRPAKYTWTEHAERNAIYNAARLGVSTRGATAYVNWWPCMDCARGLVQAGIVRLVAREPDVSNPKWGETQHAALELLQECGVQITYMPGPLGEPR